MLRKLAVIACTLAALTTAATAPAHAATAPATIAGPVAVSQPARIAVDALADVAVRTYTVVPGDMLGVIAARFCGSFGAYPGLAAASGIADPHWIYPGQTIRLSGCAVALPPAPAPAPTPTPAQPAVSDRAARVVAYALAQIGRPYVWAAAGPYGFDCSGLVMAAYARVGIRLPHSSYSMIGYGTPVSRGALRPGDVVFPYAGLGHVVIYVGGGRVVEAPHRGTNVRTTDLYSFAAARRMV